MTQTPPPTLDLREIALFLDYDGTLIPYGGSALMQSRPDPTLPPLLDRLIEGTSRATALVSGRGVAELEALIAPTRLPISGTHGAELRQTADAELEVLFPTEGLEELVAVWEKLAAGMPGLRLEVKHMTLVVHYHDLVNRKDEILEHSQHISETRPAFAPQAGHGCIEFKPAGADKGLGIARLMELETFAGRRPVFIGDDIPDEAGFAVVNSLGGISIRVGAGETQARHRLYDVAALRGWLGALAEFPSR